MTTSNTRTPFEFIKLKDLDKKEDKYDENVNALFDENDLYRKKLPKGPNSLMRAVSETLFFIPHKHEEIQQSVLTYLTQLIGSNKLTARLGSFQENSNMLKDFANNPRLPGFEKTNLELVSLLYKVRVVLYTINEDHYLTATIFNHNCTKTIELLRTKTNQYDPVFNKSFIKKAGICQNIVLNLIDRAVNGSRSSQLKNINNDEFVNISYESSLVAAAASPKDHLNVDQFRITRGHHKKSLSDNFNTNFEVMEEQQMKFYDAFMSSAPPDDFLKNFDRLRKDTAESGFSINANFDFMDEQNIDPPFQGREFAIKNYPISSSGLSPRAAVSQNNDSSPMLAFSKTKFAKNSNVHFGENLSLAEIERLEKTANSASTIDPKQLGASPFYRNVSPPGLISPNKYSQRSFTDAIKTPQSDFLSPNQRNHEGLSPYHYQGNSPNKRNMQNYMQNFQAPEQQMYNPMNNQRQYQDPNIQSFAPQSQQFMNTQGQSFNLQPHQNNNLYMKRMGNVGNSVAMQGQNDEYNMGGHNRMGYDQGMNGFGHGHGNHQQMNQMGYDQNGNYEQGGDYDEMYSPGGFEQREKKKPIILDESKERYFGRLKFFDENKKYGFIIMEDDGSDIFVHYDDLCKAGITKDLLRTARMGNLIRVTFSCMAYIGKYNKSRKAIDIQLLQ